MLNLKRREQEPIKVNVDVHHHGIEGKIERILCLVEALKAQGVCMDASLERLEASVAGIRTVADSAAALIAGIAQQLRDILGGGLTPETQQKLAQYADSLDQEKAELSQAITDNTPEAARAKPPR